MKTILVIGASGLLGGEVVKLLSHNHHVIKSSYNDNAYPVDITDINSINTLLLKTGKVDGIICTAGMVRFVEWSKASDDDWAHGLKNKLMGQINLLRYGARYLNDGGCMVLTTGALAQHPIAGSAIVSTVNAGVEAAVKSAALELNDTNIRITAVSPGWVKETMQSMGLDSTSGTAAKDIAIKYAQQIETGENGSIIVL
ncbi:short chain dehydrogenase [Ningiella sp. W23]|uniref:short chain dehydrogenase n=1 Tax=Ningiella sp. W23 TaxID=3023715 RepID=UPI0037569E72